MCITLYNTAQRLRRWSNIIQMLYKCFAFAGTILAPVAETGQPQIDRVQNRGTFLWTVIIIGKYRGG